MLALLRAGEEDEKRRVLSDAGDGDAVEWIDNSTNLTNRLLGFRSQGSNALLTSESTRRKGSRTGHVKIASLAGASSKHAKSIDGD